MNDVLFVNTRWRYDSYTHLKKLVELSGFSTCYVDEIDWSSKNTYIVSPINGELLSPLPERTCKIVWLCIERPGCYPPEKFLEFDEVWVCDRNMAARYNARFFVMGSHPDLGFFDPNKRWDIVTDCYETGRRQTVFNELKAAGYSFTPNSFNIPDSEFAASRVQLLPAQDDPSGHCVAPLRFCIAAAYRMPVIYEAQGVDLFPFLDQEHVLRANYQHLVAATQFLLAPPNNNLQVVGDNLHELLCVKTNFRQSVEALL